MPARHLASFRHFIFLILILALFLAACRTQPTAIPSPTNTSKPPTATVTLLPSASSTPLATASITPTNTPTVSPTPTLTTTPTRTPTSTRTFTPTITQSPYPPERLAVAVGPRLSPSIVFLNSDGTNLKLVEYFSPYMYVDTEGAGPGMTGNFLAISPNGRYLAFDGSEHTGYAQVYLADLSQGKVLSPIPGTDDTPIAWSPDSRYLVAAGQYPNQYQRNLILYNIETGESKPLSVGNAIHSFPSWSPDGQWIAFLQANDVYPVYPCVDLGAGCDGMYIIHPDGSGLRFLTGDIAFSIMDAPYIYTWTPPWSPDSQWLSAMSLSKYEDVLVNVHSSEIRTSDIFTWERMGWASDGRLYFANNPEGNWDIYTLRPDRSGLTNLTKSPGDEFYPSWSPSGHFVAYYYLYNDRLSLCVIYADGSRRQCFDGPEWVLGKQIAWLPVQRP